MGINRKLTSEISKVYVTIDKIKKEPQGLLNYCSKKSYSDAACS